MNTKNLKYIWLAIAVCSLSLTLFIWFGYESPILENAIFVLNGLMFALSLPCSLFAAPIVALADHYLGIKLFSVEGIYVSTFFLFILGLMQWFWIARFWSPTEPPFQPINLLADESK